MPETPCWLYSVSNLVVPYQTARVACDNAPDNRNQIPWHLSIPERLLNELLLHSIVLQFQFNYHPASLGLSISQAVDYFLTNHNVVDALSSDDETRLVRSNEVASHYFEYIHNHLCYQFDRDITKTNGSEVSYGAGLILLGDEYHQSFGRFIRDVSTF